MTCHICSHPNTHPTPLSNDRPGVQVKCINCGQFSLSDSAVQMLESFSGERWKASSWIRHNGQNQLLSSEIIGTLKAVIEPSLNTKALIALRYLANKHTLGSQFQLGIGHYIIESQTYDLTRVQFSNELGAFTWSSNPVALDFLLNQVLLTELGWVIGSPNRWGIISPKGWLALESSTNAPSHIGFCAMWFDKEVKPLWTDCIEPAILNAGYEPLRIDDVQHNNKIDDEIIASIKRAKFVIADLTGNRGGVYYEAGFAHGLGLPVIFMCRQSDDDNPHFDIRQFNTIFWSDDESILKNKPDLSKAVVTKTLQMRIEATIGKGTYVPPTSAISPT